MPSSPTSERAAVPPALAGPASPSASPEAQPTPTPADSAVPSPEPTPDPARQAEQERLRSELAAAKAKADALSAALATECPDLKPGELRHPGAVGRCARLRSEAAQAVSQYEASKKQAEAAGIAVQ
jgi:hypothetical protein